MKTNFEHFSPITSQELGEINGGGFAYDVGRILRFLSLALPGDGPSIAYAVSDWQINEMINNPD